MSTESKIGIIAYETVCFSVLNPMPIVSISGPAVKEMFKHFTDDEIELFCSAALSNEQIEQIRKRGQ